MAITSGSITVLLQVADAIQAGTMWLGSYPRLVGHGVPVSQQVITTLTNGAGANQATKVFATRFTEGTAISVDLTGVTCNDQTVGFANVRAVFAWNTDATAAHVLKFGDDTVATNLFLGQLRGTHPQYAIQPGTAYLDQRPLATAGYVVDGTHKVLRFDPGANTITWNLVVVGN